MNTILTALGMWALKLPGVGLLSLFVFVCGFIPIAGVIISTVPIGFVALTEYGFTKVCGACVCVWVASGKRVVVVSCGGWWGLGETQPRDKAGEVLPRASCMA